MVIYNNIIDVTNKQHTLLAKKTGKKYLPPLQTAETGFEAHPSSYSKGTGDLSSEVKRRGREAENSAASSVGVKTEWSYVYTSTFSL